MAIMPSGQLLKKKVTLAGTMPPKIKSNDYILEENKEQKISPTREKLNTRDPMGMYVVPRGGKPLTCLETPLPGPADYTPSVNLTKGSQPHYSIVGRAKTPPVKKNSPGPADYNTSGNLKWKKRLLTLKGRGRSCIDDEAAASNGDVGSIKVDNLRTGTGGPKYSVGMRCIKNFTGPPNSLVQPQDYYAFDSPGPNYRPNSAFWGRGPKKSFGAGRDDIDQPDHRISYPGPGDYEVYTPPTGPSYSLGRKLPPPPSVLEGLPKDGPAPNAYDIKTAIGNGPASSIRGRREEIVKGQHVNPGPTDYDIKPEILMKNSPKYTMAKRTKPSYPTAMSYITSKETPGPGSYKPEADFSQNDAPAYSFGHQATKKSGVPCPAPNVYEVEKKPIPGTIRAPIFSMAKRLETKQSNNPGPGTYTIKPLESTTPKYTMSGGRQMAKPDFNTPAPNAYGRCEMFEKKEHVSLKSRASPHVYSGFQTNKFDDRIKLLLV